MRGVIVGSAGLDGPLERVAVDTPHGPARLHRHPDGWVVFRHGRPHRLLPNQVNYRANAWALNHVGVTTLLVTSSVGVLDPEVPLFQCLAVKDLVMLDNRLPDGSACTMWTTPGEGHGHLLSDRLFSPGLLAWLDLPAVEFLYVQGPRTKTPAENRICRGWAQVNSMTLAPEVILANELGMAVAGVVVGHKRSPSGQVDITYSLERSRQALGRLIHRFLQHAPEVEAAATYRFG